MPKILVANRGEIAIRILRAATELGWDTVTLYTGNDLSHASFADQAIKLTDPGNFVNANVIVQAALRAGCTHIHPGYGFLSESTQLAVQTSEASLTFIGPSPTTLRMASDKLLSRQEAEAAGIPVASGKHVSSTRDIHEFAQMVGYPVMIKALDGGGGRGIRLVDSPESIDEAYKRCLGESPSRQVFVEKSLSGRGWKHVEVQIIGDGRGNVNHMWERECSVQRKFQKIVEIAPSHLSRSAVQPLIDASLKLAKRWKYQGLGTFEYLINSETREWVFLEVNPRVQVEHTITEEICNVDLVRAQLLLSISGTTLASLGLQNPPPAPTQSAIQLRVTAEDPALGFRLSSGVFPASQLSWPAGRGVRVDTWLTTGSNADPLAEWTVGTDFDSLLAKLIVRASSFEEATQKGIRALKETRIGGNVKTNVELLAGVLSTADWMAGTIDTLWLERNLDEVLTSGRGMLGPQKRAFSIPQKSVVAAIPSSGNAMLLPGSIFNLTLSPEKPTQNQTSQMKHTLTVSSIAHNAFPERLSGTLHTSLTSEPLMFSLTQSNSTGVSSAASFEIADPSNPSHIVSPLTGKIVELHPVLLGRVDGSRTIGKGETLVVISAMKMENVVTSPLDVTIERVGKGIETGVVLAEGMLICVANPTAVTMLSKL
ncbi:hypothetical protein AMATHDRAFT_152507 [Amanita thiersii Skay4041]|uniref:Pyruvate carboxylase n=1 Tax=Amanita thiersii Skay4041 TaxID=703135 RepID=A0A2A9NHV6_9AGAR|nr:hypothetical protein AMATHDRAFT_152507 [Amanita thiersii Skay4041]